MKAEIVNPFISSALEVLETMAGFRPKRGNPRLKGCEDRSYDISGIVGLTGQVQGVVVLSLCESAAFYVVSSFLGDSVSLLDEHAKDAVGELTNMLAGGAKRVLAAANYDLRVSIPTVVVGRNHFISRPRGIPCLEIPFETEAGPFSVELCLKSAQ